MGRRGLLVPAVVVAQANDVVLAEVVTMLHFNEHQGHRASVLNPMGSATRHIDGVTSQCFHSAAVQADYALPRDNQPMLSTPLVPLVAQTLTWTDPYRLDLVTVTLRQDDIRAHGRSA
jgi:hypothetical protein